MKKSTMRRLEQILGYGISSVQGDRTYTPVDGILYTDLFTGDLPEGIGKAAFNGKTNGLEYYNEIILNDKKCKTEVTLSQIWGSKCFCKEVQGLVDWLEDDSATDNLDEAGVKSKKIEDFSVTKGTASETQDDVQSIISSNYGYYIRKPLIVGVSSEQKDGHRYF